MNVHLNMHSGHPADVLERAMARTVRIKLFRWQLDCDETFSPVLKPATICTVLTIALSKSWSIHQPDMFRMHFYMVTLMRRSTCINHWVCTRDEHSLCTREGCPWPSMCPSCSFSSSNIWYLHQSPISSSFWWFSN